jgi:hypothetical protein
LARKFGPQIFSWSPQSGPRNKYGKNVALIGLRFARYRFGTVDQCDEALIAAADQVVAETMRLMQGPLTTADH